jgi:hypothetical protein
LNKPECLWKRPWKGHLQGIKGLVHAALWGYFEVLAPNSSAAKQPEATLYSRGLTSRCNHQITWLPRKKPRNDGYTPHAYRHIRLKCWLKGIWKLLPFEWEKLNFILLNVNVNIHLVR